MKSLLRFTLGLILAAGLLPPASAQTPAAPAGKTFIDYFLPIPAQAALARDTWGAPGVLPRDVRNGLEDPANRYCYWDGQILRADDGKYHLYASRWDEGLGHNGWWRSVAVRAESDHLMGPYTDRGLAWPDDQGGKGHNVTALRLPDGRYAVVVSETRPGEVFVSSSPTGPWTSLGPIVVDQPKWHASNYSVMLRPDGAFQIVPRSGQILISKTGITGPYRVMGPSIYPGIAGLEQRDLEDPVVWFSGGRYHIVVNSWSQRKAFHLTSQDGITGWTLRGLAYDPRVDFVRYTDGTVNRWDKLERPGVVLENGHVVAVTLSVLDVPKDQEKGGDRHGSKIIVIPFDGAALDRDLAGVPELPSTTPAVPVASTPFTPGPAPVDVTLALKPEDYPLSANFTGLSFEMQRLLPDEQGRRYFTPDNRPLLHLFRTLGIKSLRVGGNTADRPTVPFPGPADIDPLFEFARAAKVKVIFTLRLREGDPRQAAAVAKHIVDKHGDVLEAFAIGNEPNVFAPEYADFLAAWTKFAEVVNSPEFAPAAKFAGPSSTAGKNFWTRDFARDVGPTGRLLVATQHLYPGGNADLQKDPAEARRLMLSREWVRNYKQFHDGFARGVRHLGMPYRLGETNSFWNGGRAEASNTFTAALWALDYQNWWALHAAQGLNFHTGDWVARGEENGRCMYSSFWTVPGGYDVKPVGYALTAFSQSARGRIGHAIIRDNPTDLNLTAYVAHDETGVTVTLINKEYGPDARAADVSLATAPDAKVEVLTLATPDGDIARTTGFTLGGATIRENGAWDGRWAAHAPADASGKLVVRVAPATAILVKLPPAAAPPPVPLPPLAAGPFQSTWESLDAYECPEWFRDAKFGIWSHWGPQAVPGDGDWYARNIYLEGHPQYKFHLAKYGHPSEFGFKDIIPLWRAEKFDPAALMEKYAKAGAKYFVSMGVHHDNFDLWHSKHHRWNAVNMGPKRDIVGEWAAAARNHGLRFGVSEHLVRTWSWFQPSHGADKTGPKAGVPYDGNDPRYVDFYLPRHGDTREVYPVDPSPEWQRHWLDRMIDLVDQHRPDLVYSDGAVPFGAVGRAFMAHYYNRSREWHGGKLEAVYNIKDHGDDHGEYREGVAVQDLERRVLQGVKPEPWQTDSSVADWFYSTRYPYKSTADVIHMLADIVSKNGNLLLNFTQRADGSLDPQSEQILADLAAWMPVNGEALFGTRPWVKFGEGPTADPSRENAVEARLKYTAADIRFTQKAADRALYAILLGWPGDGAKVTVASLAEGAEPRTVRSVELLGAGPVAFTRNAAGLHATMPAAAPSAHAVSLKITFQD